MDTDVLKQIINGFGIHFRDVTFKPVNQGYLNDTFLVLRDEKPLYILQRINHKVFKNVALLMLNIEMALDKLQADDYSAITLLKAKDNRSFLKQKGNYWRLMTFIDGSATFNTTTNPKTAFEAGRIIGRFHVLLQDEDHANFSETIPNFNELPFRITEFHQALDSTSILRKETAGKGIIFAKETLQKFDDFYQAKLPFRICHNDTKLNNILFNKQDEALCLIDLDTIMKGYFHYDFGDAIRTIVNTANEDEIDLSKIEFNKPLFEAFIDGLTRNASFLSNKEIEYLPLATALVPFMHGLRALTDYLNGNIYYKVDYEEQNLNRSISIFHFTKLALSNQNYIKDAINSRLI